MKRQPEPVPDRVGALTPIAISSQKSKKGALWDCVCDCGMFVVRSGARLRIAARRGIRSSCVPCAVKYIHERRRTLNIPVPSSVVSNKP